MFIKSKKIKLIIIVIALLIICTVIGVLKHRESFYATRTIYSKIDIGGYGLFVDCYGKGKPTVIFESGLRCPKENWVQVQRKISKITRTFSYDRAGIGDSDASKLKKPSLSQVHELHTLLKNAKVKGPYIIVAHSIGGYNARLFAGTYPNEVAGIVFVDCSHENQLDGFENLPSKTKEDIRKQSAHEELNIDEEILSAKQVKEIRKKDSLRNIPIIVLAADHNFSDSKNKGWISFQKDIASLSNKSKYIYVKKCGHFIQMDKPQIVIDAIKEVINEVKK